MRAELVLTIDGAVNLALGVVLVTFPKGFARLVGAPIPSSSFYASLFGDVLIGIGLALLLQRFWGRSHVTGLGIEGVIAVSFLRRSCADDLADKRRSVHCDPWPCILVGCGDTRLGHRRFRDRDTCPQELPAGTLISARQA